MKKVKNFIFDFDGTLMDTSEAIMETIRDTIAEMKLPARTDAQMRSIIGIRTNEAGSHLYPELEISNAEFARVFRSNYSRIIEDTHEKAFPGVIATLDLLHRQCRGMAIASSRRIASLVAYLEKLGIKDWFDMIVGADNVEKGKPDPEAVELILSVTGWRAGETLVVGDAPVDIMMGKAAGCQTCGVTYGNGEEEDLQEIGADYIVDSLEEILRIE